MQLFRSIIFYLQKIYLLEVFLRQKTLLNRQLSTIKKTSKNLFWFGIHLKIAVNMFKQSL